MKRSVIVVAAVAAALILASGTAVATDLLCSNISQSGGIWHNVLVPAGTSCTLTNLRVTGNVTVQADGTLLDQHLRGRRHDHGDIKGDGCDSIDLETTSASGRIVVGGNLNRRSVHHLHRLPAEAEGTRSVLPPLPVSPLPNVLIGGSVKCNNNPGGCVFDYAIISGNLECSGNFDCELQSDAIGKNATINNNGSGSNWVSNSSIGGDVKCSGNSGGVDNLGNPNTVAGPSRGSVQGSSVLSQRSGSEARDLRRTRRGLQIPSPPCYTEGLLLPVLSAVEDPDELLQFLDDALALGESGGRGGRVGDERGLGQFGPGTRGLGGDSVAACRLSTVDCRLLPFCSAGGGAAFNPSSKRPSTISASSRFLAPATVKPSS